MKRNLKYPLVIDRFIKFVIFWILENHAFP